MKDLVPLGMADPIDIEIVKRPVSYQMTRSLPAIWQLTGYFANCGSGSRAVERKTGVRGGI